MGGKLKRGVMVGKRGGPCTPSPTWKFWFSADDDRVATIKEGPPRYRTATVSARKLGANLWEVEPHLLIPLVNMSHHRYHHFKDKASVHLSDHSTDQPESVSTSRGHVEASLLQHHKSVGKNWQALQPMFPASCTSLEATPSNHAVNATSLDFKRKIDQSSYSVKTSAELLKLLNRIWTLEEQLVSNESLVKALKMELNHSWEQIKELLEERHAYRQEMDALVKKFSDNKLARRNKEQERIKAAVQTVQGEQENERSLRKRSEILQHKLTRELSEVKSSFSNVLKEHQQERKARILLEDLCDELAKGIKDYEKIVRSLKHKPETGLASSGSADRLVLHISEAWLDERMQMKVSGAQRDPAEKNKIVDKLRFEIETFLQAKEFLRHKKDANLSPKELGASCFRRHSLESFPLHDAVSAPKYADNEEDSIGSLHFFKKSSSGGKLSDGNAKHQDLLEDPTKLNPAKNIGSRELVFDHNLQSLQSRFEGTEGDNLSQINNSRKLEIILAEHGDLPERNDKQVELLGLNSKHVLENFTMTKSSPLEGERIQPKNNCTDDSPEQPTYMHHNCPAVQQGMSRFTVLDPEISDLSSQLPQGLKKNTLKEKLLEARLEAQLLRSKASRGPS